MDKITLTFKTPNVADDAIEVWLAECKRPKDLTSAEVDGWLDEQEKRARDVIAKFVKYGEYLKVEIDVDKGTAEVLPAGR